MLGKSSTKVRVEVNSFIKYDFEQEFKWGKTICNVLKKRLKVMDSTAISLCMDNSLPLVVFNLTKKGNIKKVVLGEHIGTVIEG